MPSGTRSAFWMGWMSVIATLALSACGGGGGGDSGGGGGGDGGNGGNGGDQAPVGQLRFAQITAEVAERAGFATVMIERIGGSRGAISVSATSANGEATAGQDYEALSTTINFADGDSAPKAVRLNVTNDSIGEQDETVILRLSNPTGGATLIASTCILFIDDDDAATAASLAIGYEVKRLAFQWTSAMRADSYRFMVNDGVGQDFLQSGTDLAATTASTKFQIPVHLYNWEPSLLQYRVDACNGGGCAPSNSVKAIRIGSVLATGYIKASDTAMGARFGSSVAVSGNGKTVAIGAPFANGERGAIYIYTAPASGPVLFPQPLRIPAPSTQSMRFGSVVALNEEGDMLAVGAPFDDNRQFGVGTYPGAPNTDAMHSGGVFVYVRSGGVWSGTPVYIKASDVDAGDEFGSAVAFDGTTLVVGAPGQDSPTDTLDDTNSAVDSGAAYAFTAVSGNWVQSTRILKASNIGTGDRFGSSVALGKSASVILVGAPNEDGDGVGIDPADSDTKPDSGAAYRFVRVNGGTEPPQGPSEWNSPQRFKAINSGEGDHYGTAVAASSSGDVFTVGAPNEDGTLLDRPNDQGSDVGAVYAYTIPSEGPIDVAYLKALRRFDGALFGSSVALNGDGSILAVGSPRESVDEIGVDGAQNALPTSANAGAVDILMRGARASWSSPGDAAPIRHYVKASNTGAGDLFGSGASLSRDGATLVVGAPSEDGNGRNISGDNNPANNSIAESGAAYLY